MSGDPGKEPRRPETGWAALDAEELRALGVGKTGEPQGEVRRGWLRGIAQRLREETPPSEPPSEDWPPAWRAEPPEEDLAGLALSGGGIRSATFNLGVLQTLDRLGVLGLFHYLSTVSGGGYIGGFWSAWQAREPHRDGGFPAPGRGPSGGVEPEPAEIRHLREFSNFLRPRLSLLGMETARIAAAVVGGVLPSVLVASALILALLLGWLGFAFVLLASPPRSIVAMSTWVAPVTALVAGGTLTLLTLGTQLGFERLWYTGRNEEREARAPEVFQRWAYIASGAAGLCWIVLWFVLPLPFPLLLAPIPGTELGPVLATALSPGAAWLTVLLLLVVVRTATSRRGRSRGRRAAKGARDRVLSRVLFCLLAWSGLCLVWGLGQVVAAEGVAGLAALLASGGATGGAFAWARRLLAVGHQRPETGKTRQKMGAWTIKALAFLTLAAFAVAGAVLLVLLHGTFGRWTLPITGACLLLLLGLAAWLFDPQETGFHAFYRSRLVRAYLGASNPDTPPPPRGATLECESDDVKLDELRTQPLHLICCAANDLSADPLSSLHRGAESAVLSRLGFQVGARWRPWCKLFPAPGLGSAITASAAAVNTLMGSKSMKLGPAVTFLLGALGIRLGLWLEGPADGGERRKRPLKLLRRLPGLLYLSELLSLSRAGGPWVHLSDGAHFENLAFYELVRRHCRFILLSDCGADAEVAFDDFGNAVRRVREDFGVEVDIDLAPLRPGPDGRPRQPMVAGDVFYPGGDRGVLLYLKPTLVGDEPPDIAQYARRNDAFPHETTVDQFYDEAQWEAYRRLGQHVAERAFRRIPGPRNAGSRDSESLIPLVRRFLAARYAWPPADGDDPAILTEVEASWALLDRRWERAGFRDVALTDVGGDGRRTLSRQRLLAGLDPARETLQLMEAVYQRTGMSSTPSAPSHPRYMGWLNRFGRRASSAVFRAWWPWLAPLHSPLFTRFLADRFDLRAMYEWTGSVLQIPQKHSGGYALERWLAVGRSGSGAPNSVRYGFFVPMEGADEELHAGVVDLSVHCEDGVREARWAAEALFVPPGLWGVGLGQAFLEALLCKLGEIRKLRKPLEPRFHRVRIIFDEEARREPSLYALYTGAGFLPEGSELVYDLRSEKRNR